MWLGGDDNDASEAGQLEGNVHAHAPDYSQLPAGSSSSSSSGAGGPRSGFKWRGGLERMTTGIWLWSRPFIRPLPGGAPGERVAVFLMDTQGLFDSETGQMLTTSIFGLSTLISSYVVYNVSRQIQEDHLQHLALFTEYGRRVAEQQQARAAKEAAASSGAGKAKAAAAASSSAAADGDDDAASTPGDDAAGDAAADGDGGVFATDAVAALRRLGASVASRAASSLAGGHASGGAGAASSGASSVGHSSGDAQQQQPLPPFQRLEFLIRDAVVRTRNLDDAGAVEKEMADHLAVVLSKAHNKDLKSVRDHIRACFADVSAFALPHPGYAVAENEQYVGAIGEIRDVFRKLVA